MGDTKLQIQNASSFKRILNSILRLSNQIVNLYSGFI